MVAGAEFCHHLDTCANTSLLLLLPPAVSYLDSLIVSDNDVFRHSGDTKDRLILPLPGWLGVMFYCGLEGPGELPPNNLHIRWLWLSSYEGYKPLIYYYWDTPTGRQALSWLAVGCLKEILNFTQLCSARLCWQAACKTWPLLWLTNRFGH